ncbi:MAG: hypothetical protein ACFFHD_14670, partial [Promethearchaeota archaeon]
MSEQICRFCQRYVKLAYYCEECGANSCSDCLHEKKVESYVCQDCNSRNIEIIDSENKRRCTDCRSENIVKDQQLLKSCPKCGSHKIINIYEKKEELEKDFLELIKNSRIFVNPLRDVLNNLYAFQQKIKKARDPPIKYFHFPKMESDLLALFKLFIYVQNTLYDKINAHFHQLVLYKEYYFDIYTQPNTNITIIEGIFDNLLRSYNSINDFVSNNVNTFNESIKSFERNLKFIDKVGNYFITFKKHINLAEKEKPVFAIHAKLTNGLDNKERYRKEKGILFITNFDLSFIHEFGLFKKKVELSFKAPVKDLIRIKEKGKLFKKLYIEFEYGKYEFILPPKSIKRVIEYILLARTFDETTIFDKKSAKELQEIDLDLNILIDFIEESINSFFSLKCQYNKEYRNLQNYNKPFSQHFNFQPNHIQNFKSQITPHFSSQYNQNLRQIIPNNSMNSHPNNQYFGENINNFSELFQSPELLQNYRNHLNQYLPQTTYQSKFYMQNPYDPTRFQNYNSQPNNHYNNQFNNINNRHNTMRKFHQRHNFDEDPITSNEESTIQEFNRNHLSSLFNHDDILTSKSYRNKRKLYKLDKENQKKMSELEKERYGLKTTLEKLEKKFDQGLISESDYFRTYRNLNKEIYLIDKKIQKLQHNLEELESIKESNRNFY